MLFNSSVLKLFSLLIATFFLAHCTKMAETRPKFKQQATTPYILPTQAYLALSQHQLGEEKEAMLIMAAGRAIYDGQWQEATDILAQTTQLSAVLAAEKSILLAKIDIIREQSSAAITKLSAVKPLHLPLFYQAQYHQILAEAYERVGNANHSISERIKLEHLLHNDSELEKNRHLLWLTLSRLPVAELDTLTIEAVENSELQGWLKLALIPRTQQHNLLSELSDWKQHYPLHPGNSLLPKSLAAVKPYLHQSPKAMALLVPLSGPLAGPGGAIRDGFMSALNSREVAHEINVRLYDTAAGDVTALYQQAVSDGADYIVGPLTKNDVAKVAVLEHPVPTLLLNDIDVVNKTNTYRFGLSPINEAKQVAVKAHNDGFSKALIIAPSGAWGDEIVATFTTQWQQSGGLVVERFTYNENSELNTGIRDFLHVSEKEAQEKQFKKGSLDNKTFKPKRREDFDMIFLLAYPSKARQIVPLLKYYFAGDAPMYATSSVYSGSINAMRDKDLDGVIFCDMPWIFNHQLGNKNWPEQLNSYSRLYALGMDSYTLSTQINQFVVFPDMAAANQNGVFYLNRKQQVAHVLAFGKFKRGTAEKI